MIKPVSLIALLRPAWLEASYTKRETVLASAGANRADSVRIAETSPTVDAASRRTQVPIQVIAAGLNIYA